MNSNLHEGPADLDRKWLSQPEPGWREIDFQNLLGGDLVGRAKFVSEDRGDRIFSNYFWDGKDNSLNAKFWFGPEAQGPPAHVHGGAMAAVLDEMMGGACWGAGSQVLAAEINVKFRDKLPLQTRCIAKGEVVSVQGRRVLARAQLATAEGILVSEATGVFVQLSGEQMSGLRAASAGS